MIGQTVGHYNILDKIGSGGMGDVYLAQDITLDRQVALSVKISPPMAVSCTSPGETDDGDIWVMDAVGASTK